MSKTSDGGLVLNDPYSSFTLKASGATTNTTASAEDAVTGFGAMKEILFELRLTAVSITGGATCKLEAWLQRRCPDGENWDDLIAFQIASLTDGASEAIRIGEYNASLGSAAAPAARQDAGGSPPFAQRGTQISDALRVQHKITDTSGTSTARSFTWSLTAKGRP